MSAERQAMLKMLRWFFDHPGLGAVMAVAALVGMLVLGFFRADLPDAITIPLTIFVVVAGGALFVGSRRREGE
jgi:hypothetical protein